MASALLGQGPPAALEGSARVPSAAGLRSRPLAKARAILSTGAAPVYLFSDSVAERQRARPGGLKEARRLLELGPAGSVDDVEELYAAGVPVGLPSGLAWVAIHHREELIRCVSEQLSRKLHLLGARSFAPGALAWIPDAPTASFTALTQPLRAWAGCGLDGRGERDMARLGFEALAS